VAWADFGRSDELFGLEHGDFRLGTFAGLDGEMVVLDGHAYRSRGDGTVTRAASSDQVPFAVVTRFMPNIDPSVGPVLAIPSMTVLLCPTIMLHVAQQGCLLGQRTTRCLAQLRRAACPIVATLPGWGGRARLRAGSGWGCGPSCAWMCSSCQAVCHGSPMSARQEGLDAPTVPAKGAFVAFRKKCSKSMTV